LALGKLWVRNQVKSGDNLSKLLVYLLTQVISAATPSDHQTPWGDDKLDLGQNLEPV
tara:strand:- start:203 stop:373 length:171 start_codon:yes stop_codon:yes gene_type:complete